MASATFSRFGRGRCRYAPHPLQRGFGKGETTSRPMAPVLFHRFRQDKPETARAGPSERASPDRPEHIERGHRLIRPGQTSPGMPQQTAPLPPERQSLRSLRLGGACRRRFRKDGCGLTTEGRGIAKESGRRTEAGAGTGWQQGDGLSRRQALYCGGTTAGRRETNSRRAPGKNAPAPPAACGQSRRQGPFPQPASAPVMRRTAVSFMAERFVILTTSPVWGEWMNLPSPT